MTYNVFWPLFPLNGMLSNGLPKTPLQIQTTTTGIKISEYLNVNICFQKYTVFVTKSLVNLNIKNKFLTQDFVVPFPRTVKSADFRNKFPL